MSRTVNVNEEFVVVSEGKKDIGKFAVLGNDGKFDPSVVPVIENLQEQITKEVTERTEADKELQKQITKEVEDRGDADKDLLEQLNREIEARIAGDTELGSKIDAEVATRGIEDNKLQTAINNEADCRMKVDQDLQDKLDNEIVKRNNGDETEASERIDADKKLQEQIDALKKFEYIPVGAVEYFARVSAPEGWLKADGSIVSRTDYANLFSVVGTLFGEGDGNTTFNLPDLRGEFIRGFDNGRGIDNGRIMGSIQGELIKTHLHKIAANFNDYNAGRGNGGPFRLTGNDGIAEADGHPDFTVDTQQSIDGSETRPRNVALLACIKY